MIIDVESGIAIIRIRYGGRAHWPVARLDSSICTPEWALELKKAVVSEYKMNIYTTSNIVRDIIITQHAW